MKKKGDRPITKTKHPEPSRGTIDWIIWAAWADRITFEDIFEHTKVILSINLCKTSSSFLKVNTKDKLFLSVLLINCLIKQMNYKVNF